MVFEKLIFTERRILSGYAIVLETTARNGEMSINRASAWLETHEATEVLQVMRFEESDDSHSTSSRWQSMRLR